MYSITERLNGKFEGAYRVQDGTEYFEEGSRAEAVAMMLVCAEIGNHARITEADICFYAEQAVFQPAEVKVVIQRCVSVVPRAKGWDA